MKAPTTLMQHFCCKTRNIVQTNFVITLGSKPNIYESSNNISATFFVVKTFNLTFTCCLWYNWKRCANNILITL